MIYSLSNQKDLNNAAYQTGEKGIRWESFQKAFTEACNKRSREAKTVEDYLIPTFDFDEAKRHYSHGTETKIRKLDQNISDPK